MTDPLESLRVQFIERCRQDISHLEEGATDEDLARLIHRLAGIAGVFGYAELGEVAGRLDRVIGDGGRPSSLDLAELHQALLDTVTGVFRPE